MSWFREPMRHSLASRGIMTNPMFTRMNQDPEWQDKNKITISAESDFDDKEMDMEKEVRIAGKTRDNWIEMWKSNNRTPEGGLLHG